MAKILFFISLVVFAGVSACLAVKSPQVRGLGQDPASGGMLASNGLPAVAVKPADGMRLVGAGRVDVPVKRAGMFGGIPSAQGWYALHADKNCAQLLRKLHRGCAGRSTPPSMNIGEPEACAQAKRRGTECSFPPGPLSALRTMTPGCLCTWKRDRAGRGIFWCDDPASRSAFERRADASFTLLRKDGGDMFPEVIAKVERGAGKELKRRRLADVLGEVIEPETLRLRCD